MTRFKEALKKIFCLPPLATVIIAVPSFVFVCIMLKTNGNSFEISILKYISYALSAYALVITITGFSSVTDAVSHGVKKSSLTKKLHDVPIIGKYLDDTVFRTRVSMHGSSTVNFAYIFINLYSGIYHRSLWFAALSIYYAFLAATRFMLLRYMRKNQAGKELFDEWKRFRLTGIILLLLNQALAVIVMLVVVQNKGFEYSGLLIYVMAAYAFYSLITAIINLVKFRKYNSPVLSASKAVNLVSALVSMLSLTTAMLSHFGEKDTKEFRQTMTACTGLAICGFILIMSTFMMVLSSKRLKEARLNAEQ